MGGTPARVFGGVVSTHRKN